MLQSRSFRHSSLAESRHFFDHAVLFASFQFGVDGERENFGGGLFGVGEVAGLVAEGGEALLQVEGDWVVDRAADFAFGEIVAEGVAAVVEVRNPDSKAILASSGCEVAGF